MEAIEKLINKIVVIRADRAGVFYGTLAEIEPLGDKYQVELKDCRRLWYWSGAASITQLACEGVKNPNLCKFTMRQKSIVVNGVIEVHQCTDESIKSIENVAEWKKL
jgi:hypothetical protein